MEETTMLFDCSKTCVAERLHDNDSDDDDTISEKAMQSRRQVTESRADTCCREDPKNDSERVRHYQGSLAERVLSQDQAH